MEVPITVYVGEDAIANLIDFVRSQKLVRFRLVADPRTHAALGGQLEPALAAAGFSVSTTVLDSAEVIADADHILRVFLDAGSEQCVYLAVGGGTITDITRFVSHRSGAPFIAVPTAPSVDGFTSIGAPLVIDGIKRTVICQAPIALFGDLEVLRHAPQSLIAAGYGDMVGKLLSAADWRLGHILWDEPYSESIARRLDKVAAESMIYAEEVGQGSRSGISALMNGLIESGFCMLDFGNSNPASGAEHHLSHFWEMWLLRHGRPAIFHGTKVGIASVMTARLYGQIARLGRAEAERRLQAAALPDRALRIEAIERAFGPIAGQIIREQAPFLDMTPGRFAELKARILAHWHDVQEIARALPPAGRLASSLRAAGGTADPASAGLDADLVRLGARYGHYLRVRFTVARLAELLGIDEWWVDWEAITRAIAT